MMPFHCFYKGLKIMSVRILKKIKQSFSVDILRLQNSNSFFNLNIIEKLT